jgi:endonuclease-8
VPEGDTVFLAATRLDRALRGRLVTRSDFRIPHLATTDVSGRTITKVRSYGKHLFFEMDEVVLHTHFKMDGTWHLYRTSERWKGPDFQVRAILTTDAWTAVGFRLPLIELLDRAAADRSVAHLGPDLLGNWDEDEALRRLRSQPDRPIGEALLDQRNLAGLGNIYRAEACFLRGVEPSTIVAAVRDLEGLVRLSQRLIEANRTTGNQVTTGMDRRGARQWVYGRGGSPCRRCATSIRSYEDGGGRVVYVCPSCQPTSAIVGTS